MEMEMEWRRMDGGKAAHSPKKTQEPNHIIVYHMVCCAVLCCPSMDMDMDIDIEMDIIKARYY